MKTLVVTGGIGSGKSFLCRELVRRGIPVFDSDSQAKALYVTHPELAAMLVPDIFSRKEDLAALENALYPVLMDEFRKWAADCDTQLVAFESAVILQKPFFDGFGDYVIWMDAPLSSRKERVSHRAGLTEESLKRRMALQTDEKNNPRVSVVLDNSGDKQYVVKQLDNFLKSINYGREN